MITFPGMREEQLEAVLTKLRMGREEIGIKITHLRDHSYHVIRRVIRDGAPDATEKAFDRNALPPKEDNDSTSNITVTPGHDDESSENDDDDLAGYCVTPFKFFLNPLVTCAAYYGHNVMRWLRPTTYLGLTYSSATTRVVLPILINGYTMKNKKPVQRGSHVVVMVLDFPTQECVYFDWDGNEVSALVGEDLFDKIQAANPEFAGWVFRIDYLRVVNDHDDLTDSDNQMYVILAVLGFFL